MPEAPPPTLTERNKKSLEFIEDVTSNPDEVQQKVLSDILTRHKMLTSNIFNVMGFTFGDAGAKEKLRPNDRRP
ncbi:hypothetical protein Tco_1320504 [Tanacetum coccineum]